jgi:hypothetical protein
MLYVKTVVLGIAATAITMAAASAAPSEESAPNLCLRLVEKSRQLPSAAWSEGIEALKPSLQLKQDADEVTPLEKKIVALPAIAELLGNEGGGYRVFIERFPKTNIYLAYNVQGTADCQYFAFVAAAEGQPPQLIASPVHSDEGDFCWTSAGSAGTVFGQPAFVETDGFDVAQPAVDTVKIWPWSDSGWGLGCQLRLSYQTVERLTERFCGDVAACRRVAPLAVAIAEAHRRSRKIGEPFHFGVAAPAVATGAVAHIAAALPQSTTTEFPTFGTTAKTRFTDFSYEDFDLFPLTVDGVTYAAAIGYGGVGWRRIGDALLAVYEIRGDQLYPVASFVIARSIVGLQTASVETKTH